MCLIVNPELELLDGLPVRDEGNGRVYWMDNHYGRYLPNGHMIAVLFGGHSNMSHIKPFPADRVGEPMAANTQLLTDKDSGNTYLINMIGGREVKRPISPAAMLFCQVTNRQPVRDSAAKYPDGSPIHYVQLH